MKIWQDRRREEKRRGNEGRKGEGGRGWEGEHLDREEGGAHSHTYTRTMRDENFSIFDVSN